ncbi:MAG: DNA repair protein RecN [Tissierellia bacterium]|nr:DNA repair protein RecN [Tissierellia bacterium]
MLYRLNIENFAIIQQSSIDFTRGFNVLTGETGAGKSILMDALGLLLGDRAQKSMIRQGEESAYIQGIFSMDPRLEKILKERNLPIEETVTIERMIFYDRPGIVQINGRSVTISFLQRVAQRLARASYQGENQYLLSPEYQRKILDTLAGGPQREDRELLEKTLEGLRAVEEELTGLTTDPEQRAREGELLDYQIAELEELNFSPNEDEILEERFRSLNHTREIRELLQASRGLLYEDGGLLFQYDQLLSMVLKLSEFDEAYSQMYSELEAYSYEIREQAAQLRDQLESLDEDPRTLMEIQQRLDAMNRAKRKYAPTLEGIGEFLDRAREKRQKLTDFEELEGELRRRREKILEEAQVISDRLHMRRLAAAGSFQEKLSAILEELDISGAQLDIRLEEAPLSRYGRDSVHFYIQTNIGEGLKPLNEIASGGEISRIQLGIQSIMADYEDVDLMIFDEIDTGMSGRTARVVARKMADMAQNHQLLVVSHLPQVIARGDVQYQIQKDQEEGRTRSFVKPLDREERVEALAMIISGEATASSMETARQMMEEK